MLERSAQAPQHWRQEFTEAAVRDFVLKTSPDVVLFQELPRMVPFVETHGMIKANPETHSGNLAVLVKQELLATEPSHVTIKGCAVLVTFGDLTIANVHLEPGPAGTGKRLEQFAEIVEASPTSNIVIAGDTNTRVDEEEPLAEAGLLGERPPQPTWNGKKNRFRHGAEFSAYFTRWFATESVAVSDVKVWTDPIDSESEEFYLSDHFALSATVSLADG